VIIAYANLSKIPSYVDKTYKCKLGKKVHSASAKLNLWCDVINRDIGNDPILFIDCDTIMVKPIDEYWDLDFDIGYTKKTFEDENLKWPINTGVILVKNVEKGKKFFEFWKNETNKILADGKLKYKASVGWGAADQAALGENIDKFEDIKFKAFRCCELNETRCVPIGEDLHIIHYKGLWHKVFSKETWSEARPKNKCEEMYNLRMKYYRSELP
jgi:hypothetical protein